MLLHLFVLLFCFGCNSVAENRRLGAFVIVKRIVVKNLKIVFIRNTFSYRKITRERKHKLIVNIFLSRNSCFFSNVWCVFRIINYLQFRQAIIIGNLSLADRAKHKPSELSGGQQQRVAIARAIVADPTLLVCDEPTGDLDRETSESVLQLLELLNRDQGKTIVMVTHDPRAAGHASRRLYVDKGSLGDAPLGVAA